MQNQNGSSGLQEFNLTSLKVLIYLKTNVSQRGSSRHPEIGRKGLRLDKHRKGAEESTHPKGPRVWTLARSPPRRRWMTNLTANISQSHWQNDLYCCSYISYKYQILCNTLIRITCLPTPLRQLFGSPHESAYRIEKGCFVIRHSVF